MKLTQFLRDELEHKRGVAEDERDNCAEQDENEDAADWSKTVEGINALLNGSPNVADDHFKALTDEIENMTQMEYDAKERRQLDILCIELGMRYVYETGPHIVRNYTPRTMTYKGVKYIV